MPEKHLLLYFDAPMQSWGHSSHFERRTTAAWPTKSGVIGMLCAAMGIKRNDEMTISQLTTLNMKVYVLQQSEVRLMDYHTVGERHSNNKSSSEKHTITQREYLVDHKFGVVMSGKEELLLRCQHALENPQWGVWFGRKNCIPATRIYEGLYDSTRDALSHLYEITKYKPKIKVIDIDHFNEGIDTLLDIPINYESRKYKPRRINIED